MTNIKKLAALAAAGALFALVADAQVQQTTPQQASASTSEPVKKQSPREAAQAYIDGVSAGDIPWETARKWGYKPEKLIIDRVEIDMDEARVYCRPIVGIVRNISLRMDSEGIWAITSHPSALKCIVLLENARPLEKVARTWLDAITGEDWGKANSVTNGYLHSSNASYIRKIREARQSGKKLPPITTEYVEFTGNETARIYFNTGREKGSIDLYSEEGVWFVTSPTYGDWPTKEFWKGVW